jgi:hypothetical protein
VRPPPPRTLVHLGPRPIRPKRRGPEEELRAVGQLRLLELLLDVAEHVLDVQVEARNVTDILP